MAVAGSLARTVGARALLLALALAAATTTARAAEPRFPALGGRIVDEARLLTPEDRRTLESELAALETRSSDQLVVVTVPSLQGLEIEDYGYRLGRHWGIGQAGGKNNGVLLIIAPSERRVRIEVGRGLEPVLTDALARLIIENRILPAFRRGETSAGILAGARDIRDVLLGDGEEVKRRAQGFRRPVGQQPDGGLPIGLILWIAVVVFLLLRAAHAPRPPGRPGQRRRIDRPGWIIVPTPPSSGHWPRDRGGWSGDGGFKGGGGDFGGGGATGRW